MIDIRGVDYYTNQFCIAGARTSLRRVYATSKLVKKLIDMAYSIQVDVGYRAIKKYRPDIHSQTMRKYG